MNLLILFMGSFFWVGMLTVKQTLENRRTCIKVEKRVVHHNIIIKHQWVGI